MILTVLIFMYCSFLCEKILTFYVCLFFFKFSWKSALLNSIGRSRNSENILEFTMMQ